MYSKKNRQKSCPIVIVSPYLCMKNDSHQFFSLSPYCAVFKLAYQFHLQDTEQSARARYEREREREKEKPVCGPHSTTHCPMYICSVIFGANRLSDGSGSK